ncbi:MAG: hypothetical protein ABL925_12810 [Methylococcales bacterium]
MIDFMLSIFSAVFQMNLRDHHDMPFALPLVMFACTGFIIAFVILKFIGNEEADLQEQAAALESADKPD